MQERLGHANAVMTLDRYGRLPPGLEREATAQLDAILG